MGTRRRNHLLSIRRSKGDGMLQAGGHGEHRNPHRPKRHGLALRNPQRQPERSLVSRTRSSHTACGKLDCELWVQKGHWNHKVASAPLMPKFVSERSAKLTN